MPDDFEDADINALYKQHLRHGARGERSSIMREQAARREGRASTDAPAAPIVLGEVDGRQRWTLHGTPVRSGQVVEIYTNKANGWMRGQLSWSGEVADRPRLVITLWNPWGGRDVDGLPPRVGEIDAEIPAGAVCRWSAALPQEID